MADWVSSTTPDSSTAWPVVKPVLAWRSLLHLCHAHTEVEVELPDSLPAYDLLLSRLRLDQLLSRVQSPGCCDAKRHRLPDWLAA